MGILQGILPGSDPNSPNAFIQTPEMLARQQALAQALMQEGSSSAPIRSPWQGLSNLAKALEGGYESGQVQRGQRLGMANAAAESAPQALALGGDPSEANIPSTPGQTTPALRQSDAITDAITDAPDSAADPRRAALAAALGGGSAPASGAAQP